MTLGDVNLETLGIFTMETYGNIWKHMETYGNIWCLIVIFMMVNDGYLSGWWLTNQIWILMDFGDVNLESP